MPPSSRGQHILQTDADKLAAVEQGKLDLPSPDTRPDIFDITSEPGWLITPWGRYERLRPLRRIIRDGPTQPANPNACWACGRERWHAHPNGERICLICHPIDGVIPAVYAKPAQPLLDVPDQKRGTLAQPRAPKARPERKAKPTITAQQAKYAWTPISATPSNGEAKHDKDLPL
jgi:hypothetical protein